MNFKKLTIGLFVSVSMSFVASNVMAQQQKMTPQDMDGRLDNLYGTHDIYHCFFDALKEDITQRNKAKVAAVVKYPLFVQLKGKQVKIRSKQQFVKNYDAIITPKIEKIVKEQQFKELISTYRGMAFGNGEIWFAGVCQENTCKDHNKTVVKVIGINNFM